MIPRRKVPVGRLQPTARIPGFANESIEVEGPLEQDFVLLTKFDPLTLDIRSQPFTLRYEHPSGRTYNCTPDFIVSRLQGPIDNREIKVVVYEVRRKEDADMADPTFAARFEAVSNHCRKFGVTHEIVTEDEIRIPKLENAKLLLPHAHAEMPEGVIRTACMLAKTKEGIPFGQLLTKAREAVKAPGNVKASLYWILLNRFLMWDVEKKLTSETLIYDWEVWPGSRSKRARA